MNLLLDFEMKELAIIHASLLATANVVSQDESAPEGLAESAINTLNKLQQVIELRFKNESDFTSLVESSLTDLQQQSTAIINETENN